VAIEGFDGAGVLPAYLMSQLGAPPKTGTDVLVVRGAIGAPARVRAENSAVAVFTGTGQNFGAGDLLVLSDCGKARVFQAGDISTDQGVRTITHPASGVPGNDPAVWGSGGDTNDFRFGTDARVYKVRTRLFYIRPNPDQIPALYLKAGANVPRELIAGVEDMQLLYGVDSAEPSGVASQYFTADQVTAAAAWPRVVSVRIQLLLRSLNDRLADAPQPYTFNGVAVTPPADDLRLRRVFTTTAALRNRLL
jgi:type IV pilus assembly protein PilW